MKSLTILTTLLMTTAHLMADPLLPGKLTEKDSVVVLRIDSKKPAKVEIFNCTIEKVIHGEILDKNPTISFLHFPNCERLQIGKTYSCIVRHGFGYEFVRSDMLKEKQDDEKLFTCAWEAGTKESEKLRSMFSREESTPSE